jgi:transcriptional regulator with XRE-family HTH domain/fido (protein-threonine AMPylation protein)
MATLKELRLGRDLSQKKLAQISGVRFETLSRIEAGKQSPHNSTISKLAKALRVDEGTIELSLREEKKQDGFQSWDFLRGLDPDLKKGLLEELVCSWTHHSTSIEGNTISEGDTHLILTEGLTVKGKSLKEHQEIHGHGSAVKQISSWLKEQHPITINRCHELHRLIQTEMVFDIYAPIGKWKVESNGTRTLRSDGSPFWHSYSEPIHIPKLMSRWVEECERLSRAIKDVSSAIRAYTRCHVGFVKIHPYADGNGRMARILANAPLLQAGYPPVVIQKQDRTEYIQLLGDYAHVNPSPTPDNPDPVNGDQLDNLRDFFEDQWGSTLEVVKEFWNRQIGRQGDDAEPPKKILSLF